MMATSSTPAARAPHAVLLQYYIVAAENLEDLDEA
jgi:hypothetical protein